MGAYIERLRKVTSFSLRIVTAAVFQMQGVKM